MPRYRFRWEQLPTRLTRRLARDLQLDGDSPVALRKAYGARPGEDFVRDAWPSLRDAWLAKDGPALRSITTLLRERRLGDMTMPVGNRQERLDYLGSCRNSSKLRQIVVEEFRTYGSVRDTRVGTHDADPLGVVDEADELNDDEATGGSSERVIRREPAEFDLDKRLTMAWGQMHARLTAALAGLEDETTLSIQLPSAYDGDNLDGSIPYLQFRGYGDRSVRGEVSSNHVLDEKHRLSNQQGRALLELGWNAPASDPGDPGTNDGANFWIEANYPALGDLAESSVAAIRDVFGVPHPSFLEAFGLHRDTTADLLGHPRQASAAEEEAAAESSAVDDDESLAIEPTDRDHLVDLVDAALVPVVGGMPPHDDDGDIPIREGSAIVFVRVAEDGPYVELFSPILVGVRGSPLALERVSQLNRWVRFVSFGWDAGTVHASMHLYCSPFVPKHLRHAVEVLTSVADRLDDELRLGLGGRAFFGNEEDSGTDEVSPDPTRDEELPEALLTLMQLDANAEGAVTAEEAADICGRNRRAILDYIRIAEQQVIEWRSSAEEALGDGDTDEWAACTHEGKAWQSTVDLLRSALRLVARN